LINVANGVPFHVTTIGGSHGQRTGYPEGIQKETREIPEGKTGSQESEKSGKAGLITPDSYHHPQ
jgi:hypothetical protein